MFKKLSIIIPVFNTSEIMLRRCLDSIEIRTDFEVVFIDDASTDFETIQTLKDFKKLKNVRVFFLKKNKRQGNARNVGIKKSRGKYITFVDSDDYFEKGRLSILLSEAIEKKIDIVYSSASYGNDEKGYKKMNPEDDIAQFDGIIPLKAHLIYKGISVFRGVYNKKLIKKNKIYFPTDVFFEDNYWVAIVTYHAQSFKFIEGTDYLYQKYEGQTTSNFNQIKLEDRLCTSKMLLDFSRDVDNEILKSALESRFIRLYLINSLNFMNSNFSQFSDEDYNYLISSISKIFPNYYKNETIFNDLPKIVHSYDPNNYFEKLAKIYDKKTNGE